MMKVLVTGFDPFGREAINPAFLAMEKVKDRIPGARISKLEVPTVFHRSIQVLKEAIEKEKPDIVLCLGQAGGRYDISIERLAINLDDARIEDNEGNQPIDEKIFEDGENAYFTKLPIKAMVKNIRDQGIPASVSNTAGTFVCNHLMYGLLYMIEKDYPHIRGGFIHVPFIPDQVLEKTNSPSMSLEDITKAIEHAIEAALGNDEDIVETGGKIS